MGTVLVVDGDIRLLSTFRESLEGAGHEVIAAPDPLPKAWWHDAQSPSVIICDLSAPSKNAFTTIHNMRLHFATTPIVAISASTDAVVEDHARRCGASFVIPEGSDADRMHDLLSGILAFRHRPRRCYV